LLSILNKSLKNISQNDHKEIYNKWSSTQLIEKIDYSLVWKIGLVILILLVIIVYWNYKLKMLVNERTNELLELNKSLNNIVKEEVENNRKNEFKLMEQAKMVSLGEMIGNIAHQWRQPLSIISSATSGMQVQKQMNILTDEEFLNSCKVINNNTQYLSKTIDTFRDFIKEDKSIKDILLQERIDKVLEIITPSLKGNYINLINKIDYSDPIKMILNIGELDQVIINIINNAKDILVERKIEHKIITLDLDKQQDKIIISIEDNGGGIPDDIMPRIFEPYFTTKHQSIGTGLGLHMSYKIVNESLNGDLYVENTKNGAKFFIELPLT
jgi:signal transduction histidine kinase